MPGKPEATAAEGRSRCGGTCSVWGVSNLGLPGWFLSWDGTLPPHVTSPQAPSAAPAPVWSSDNNGHEGFLLFCVLLSVIFPRKYLLFRVHEHRGVSSGMPVLPYVECAAGDIVAHPILRYFQLYRQIRDREPGERAFRKPKAMTYWLAYTGFLSFGTTDIWARSFLQGSSGCGGCPVLYRMFSSVPGL